MQNFWQISRSFSAKIDENGQFCTNIALGDDYAAHCILQVWVMMFERNSKLELVRFNDPDALIVIRRSATSIGYPYRITISPKSR